MSHHLLLYLYLLFANLFSTLHCSHISPGKYSRLLDLDYFHIAVNGEKVEITYHHHLVHIENATFLPDGELAQLELPWDHNGRLRGARHSELRSVIKAYNTTHIVESHGDQEWLWRRVSDEDEVENRLVEIAVIGKPNTRDETFIHRAFTLSPMPAVHYWGGIYGVSECPTNEVGYLDKNHNASKVIGITLAHYRIWQEFYRRYRDGDWKKRILILESDIRCGPKFCGDIAAEHINRTDKDFLFIGWCDIIPSDNFQEPPVCAHAYSISVKAAKILMDNVFPCLSPVDGQITRLCKRGLLSWATAGPDEDRQLRQTSGLIRQHGW